MTLGVAYQVPSIDELHDAIRISGLKKHEFVALYGGGYVIGDRGEKRSCNGIYCRRRSFVSSAPSPDSWLSNKFFKLLFDKKWEAMQTKSVYTIRGIPMYKAAGEDEYMLPQDLLFRDDSVLSPIAKKYASDNELFLNDFRKAWTKLSNIDRFDGPIGNVCEK